MPKARQSCAIGSPLRGCATNRRRSSITEHSFHGIHTSRFWEKAEDVTHVSGTNCHPCLGPLTVAYAGLELVRRMKTNESSNKVAERSPSSEEQGRLLT